MLLFRTVVKNMMTQATRLNNHKGIVKPEKESVECDNVIQRGIPANGPISAIVKRIRSVPGTLPIR